MYTNVPDSWSLSRIGPRKKKLTRENEPLTQYIVSEISIMQQRAST